MKFSAIVAVNNDRQYEDNILDSPGLREVSAPIVVVREATSAADAFYKGLPRTVSPWLLFCHQDVFFPARTGFEIEKKLDSFSQSDIIGFAGMSGELNGPASNAGLVLDRGTLRDWPSTDTAISIDELAILIHRDSVCRIDPNLKWDLWATDLCLQARLGGSCARIIRVLLHHNSRNQYVLPEAWFTSRKILAAKYPQLGRIRTLCGDVK